MHLRLFLLWRFGVTQRPLTLRPRAGCVKSNRTVTGLSSEYLNVVPTGGRLRATVTARKLPATRNFSFDSLELETAEAVAGMTSGVPVDSPGPVGGPFDTTVAVTVWVV